MKLITAPFLICAFSAAALAQNGFQDNTQRKLSCEEHNENSARFHACEVREQTMGASGSLHVDAGQNGGVTVKGWNQPGVLVRSKIEASSDSASESRSLMSAVQVHSSAGHVSASGPKTEGDNNWSVSYEVFVPHKTNLDVQAHNGGVHVSDVGGTMDLHTVNGGLHLTRLTGTVTGVTVNGGVHVDLMDDHWDGGGLDVTSTNGGVHVTVPQSYSAHIEGSTVNGGIRSDFPELAAPGRADRSQLRSVAASIGHGGAPIHVATVNGGLTIARQ